VSVSKNALASIISKRLGLSKKESLSLFEFFISFIKNNNNVNIRGFGTFTRVSTPTRIGRNPKTKKKYEILAREKLILKASDQIKKELN
tara:strand:+ start:484 stop:750 length:267 start_codon:yes stop_codon:yes gene_type:complete